MGVDLKTCSNCGGAESGSATFCGSCGKRLGSPIQPEAAQPRPDLSSPSTYSATPPRVQKPPLADRLDNLEKAGTSALKAGCSLALAVPLLLVLIVLIGGLLFG